MTVAEAQARVDSREFAAWLAYDRVEPFGESRADLRTAIVACVVANANRGKAGQAFTPKDFMPDFSHRPSQSPDEIQSRLFVLAEVHNHRVQRKGKR